jgi:hypothetical protein
MRVFLPNLFHIFRSYHTENKKATDLQNYSTSGPTTTKWSDEKNRIPRHPYGHREWPLGRGHLGRDYWDSWNELGCPGPLNEVMRTQVTRRPYGHREWPLGWGHLGPGEQRCPGPLTATDNRRWDIVLFRNGMLGREHKTPKLSTCFQTDEKTCEMNRGSPGAPTATQNGY